MTIPRFSLLLAAAVVPLCEADPEQTDVVSAYHGGYILAPAAQLFCPDVGDVVGQGGMPVVFSEPLQSPGAEFALDPGNFSVTVGGDRAVTPVCATLQPAVDPGEGSTVLPVVDFRPLDPATRCLRCAPDLRSDRLNRCPP